MSLPVKALQAQEAKVEALWAKVALNREDKSLVDSWKRESFRETAAVICLYEILEHTDHLTKDQLKDLPLALLRVFPVSAPKVQPQEPAPAPAPKKSHKASNDAKINREAESFKRFTNHGLVQEAGAELRPTHIILAYKEWYQRDYLVREGLTKKRILELFHDWAHTTAYEAGGTIITEGEQLSIVAGWRVKEGDGLTD
jgi:hypothetical protein